MSTEPSQANPDSTGNAGSVTLTVEGLLEVLRGAEISSSTFAKGDAGNVTVTAGAARFDRYGAGFTGLASIAAPGSSGNAGTVTLTVADLLEVLRGAEISSNTVALGDAGDVNINAGRIFAQSGGIGSIAGTNATGTAGRVAVTADQIQLDDGSLISIASRNPNAQLPADNQTRQPPSLRIQAGTLRLNDSEIGAQSRGAVPAASIHIQADNTILANSSRISTESQQANAGAIDFGGGVLWLKNSQITTSAEGSAGDGGNIRIGSRQLILDGGFIQANATAEGARGGDIAIDSRVMIASQGQVEIGGLNRQRFFPGIGQNIIQAASPGGESGTISVTAIGIDSGALIAPPSHPYDDPDDLFPDPCRGLATGRLSRFVERGAGGQAPPPDSATGLPVAGERLERALAE